MFELTNQPINIVELRESLSGRKSGALAVFEGWVRDHNEGMAVVSLEYEAYPELAAKEGETILQEAVDRFDLHAARCVHRLGALEIGDVAVWVGVSAAHRREAFAACQYIIDEVKARVPIWKREQYADGRVEWVNCTRSSGSGTVCGERREPLAHGRHGHEHAH